MKEKDDKKDCHVADAPRNDKIKRNVKKRVIIAMSGGVDSSVAAAILKDQGYDVVGVFMKLWAEPKNITSDVIENGLRENICCSVEASTAARAVARKLDIPFYVVNFSEDFKRFVVDNYIKEYENGRTPNPCVLCNRDIKGQLLFQKMKELGGDYLATGHYARIKKVKSQKSKVESYSLFQGKDKTKDQTYFLWTLTQEHLAHLLFPVGDLIKPEVRKLALKYELPTAERRESQGLCFIPDRDVAGFLKRHAKKLKEPGAIEDIDGKIVGRHLGLVNYTIGQREGLGLGGPRSYYVVKLDINTNTLMVGDEKDLYQKDLVATDVNWLTANSQQLTANSLGARIRHGHPIESCEIKAVSGKRLPAGEAGLTVNFSKPQRAITPGQSIVFYDGEELIGGGIIE